ncbi:MAG: hypothetical protein ACOC1K_03225 [Nanoarchaeota archaeon]
MNLSWIKDIWDFLNSTPPQPEVIENNLEKITEIIEHHTVGFILRALISVIQFLEKIILTTPSKYMTTEPFWEIYNQMINLSLALLGICLLLITFYIIKEDNQKIKGIGEKLLLYPFGVILSPYILLKTIDIFNRIASTVISTNAIKIPSQTTFSSLLGLIIYMIIMIILSGKLIYFYAKRFVKIILFAVLAPIIFSVWCVPRFSNIVDNWFDYILGLLVSQVIHALILLILGNIIMGVSEINNILAFVFQIGGLGVMNEAEEMFIKLFGGNDKLTPDSWHKQISKWRRNVKTTKGVTKVIKGVIGKWI